MYMLPFLLDEIKLSNWAYHYCKDIKDDPEIRKLITDSYNSYRYCLNIQDTHEVRKNIIESNWVYCYYKFVKGVKNAK